MLFIKMYMYLKFHFFFPNKLIVSLLRFLISRLRVFLLPLTFLI